MEKSGDIWVFLIHGLSKDAGFKFPLYCKKFGELQTNVERMNFVYGDTEKHKAYPAFKKDQKRDVEATKLRERGNECYKRGNNREALDFYTMSILNAKSKETIALGYGNRSAVLFKLKLYSECVKDIDRAFENNYPDKLKEKLIARKKSAKTLKGITVKYHEAVPKIVESKKNPQIQCAKNCIKIVKNQQYGRHIVATRKIEIGEIIAVEPLYCAIIEDEIYVHCHECFVLCYDLIPCDKCTQALYCGTTCKDKAFERYHKYECPILLTLDSAKIDFPKRLALKIVFMSRNEWDVEDSDELETTEYRSDRFQEFYNLLNHLENRTVDNLLCRTAYSCAFLYLIKNHTTFLQDNSNEDRQKHMLLSMVLSCGINTVDLNELAQGIPSIGPYDLQSIATATYSFFTMFNHSCWPNVSRHFYGSSMVLRASNTINEGEQCFVCYGPRWSSYTREFRQNFLSEYQFFTCTCRACEENWPVVVDVAQLFMKMTTRMKLNITANVDLAKNELKQLIFEVRRDEKSKIPNYIFKDLLFKCYNIFGNVRRF